MKGPSINGKPHQLVVLRITARDDMGRPSECLIGYDDTTFRVDDPSVSNDFLTAFVQADSVKPRTASQ